MASMYTWSNLPEVGTTMSYSHSAYDSAKVLATKHNYVELDSLQRHPSRRDAHKHHRLRRGVKLTFKVPCKTKNQPPEDYSLLVLSVGGIIPREKKASFSRVVSCCLAKEGEAWPDPVLISAAHLPSAAYLKVGGVTDTRTCTRTHARTPTTPPPYPQPPTLSHTHAGEPGEDQKVFQGNGDGCPDNSEGGILCTH